VPKGGVSDRAFSNNVNRTAEEGLQCFGEAKVTIGKARHLSVSKGRYKIEIASFWIKFPASSRAEEVETPDTETAAKALDCVTSLSDRFDYWLVAFLSDVCFKNGCYATRLILPGLADSSIDPNKRSSNSLIHSSKTTCNFVKRTWGRRWRTPLRSHLRCQTS